MNDRYNDDERDASRGEGSYAADGDGVGDDGHDDDDDDSHNSDGVDDDDVDDSESDCHDACHDASEDASDDGSGDVGSTGRDEATDQNSPLVSPEGSEEESEGSETHNETDSSGEASGSLSPERENNAGKDAVQEQGNDLPDTATQRKEEKEKDDAENYSDCEDDLEEADDPADDSDEHEAPTTENLQHTPLPDENGASDDTTERSCDSRGVDNIESVKNLPNEDGIESAVVVTERSCDSGGVDNIESEKNLPNEDRIESAVVVDGSDDSAVLDSPTVVDVATQSHDAEEPDVLFQMNDSDIEKGTSTADNENHVTRPTDNSSLNVEKAAKSDTSASMEPHRLWTRWIPFGLAFVAFVISVIGISVALRNQDNESPGTESANPGVVSGNEIWTEPDRSKCRTLKNVTFDSDAFGNPYPLAITVDTFASAGFATLSSESRSPYVLRTASRLTGQPIGSCNDRNSDAYHEIIPVLAANDYDCKERFESAGTLAFWFQQDTVRVLQIGLLRWRKSFFHIPPVEITVTPTTDEPAVQMLLPQVNDLPVYDPRTPWYETLTIDHQQTGVLRVHGQVAVTFIEFCEENDF